MVRIGLTVPVATGSEVPCEVTCQEVLPFSKNSLESGLSKLGIYIYIHTHSVTVCEIPKP